MKRTDLSSKNHQNQQSAEEVSKHYLNILVEQLAFNAQGFDAERLFNMLRDTITADRLATEQRVRDRECVWKEAELNAYSTACGFSYRLFDEPAHENYDHCPKCAGKINCGGRIKEAGDG